MQKVTSFSVVKKEKRKACKEIHNTSFYDLGNMQCLWFNRNIRSRTKQYLFYEDWYEKAIQFISDLLNPPLPGSTDLWRIGSWLRWFLSMVEENLIFLWKGNP